MAVIVESELDALLLYQEAGDIALMVALGSVVKRPDQGIHARLKLAQIILNALTLMKPEQRKLGDSS